VGASIAISEQQYYRRATANGSSCIVRLSHYIRSCNVEVGGRQHKGTSKVTCIYGDVSACVCEI
jgi:hypothetical protein